MEADKGFKELPLYGERQKSPSSDFQGSNLKEKEKDRNKWRKHELPVQTPRGMLEGQKEGQGLA